MMSATVRECDFTYSLASICFEVKYSSHHERRRSVPASARFVSRIFATSSTRAFGPTVMTLETMTSAAVMSRNPLRYDYSSEPRQRAHCFQGCSVGTIVFPFLRDHAR